MARLRAPELRGAGGWIGTVAPLALDDLLGKVVAIHFWTSCCINCLRVIEELRLIQAQYTDALVVVGVHSPKFPHEHEHRAVEQAVQRHGIDHPVLDDPDLVTWRQYGVRVWPTLVVIDPEGYIVGGVTGEGCGPLLTQTIEGLVTVHRANGTLVDTAVPALQPLVAPPPSLRQLAFPGKVAVDPSRRRIAISDTGHDRVIVSDLDGRVEAMFESLRHPQGVRFDGNRLIVCETGADRVVAVPFDGSLPTVLASGLASPWDVCADHDGSLVVAEAGRHRLWRLREGEAPIVVAGSGQENLIDGPGTDALLAQPSGLARVNGGMAFVDAEASALRVLRDDGTVVTLVGQGLFDWGASDGGPASAALQHPLGLASPAGPLDSLYIADTFNSLLRQWTGTSPEANAGSLQTLPVEGLDEPGGLDVLDDGRLVVADTNHHRIVLVDPATGATTPIVLDESWLGTASGDPLTAVAGDAVVVPYAIDPGSYQLDDGDGPPAHIEVQPTPATLLGPGPRRWALDAPSGELTLPAGRPGTGFVVVDIALSVCDDVQCTVLQRKTRHAVTVVTSDVSAPAG